MNKAKNLLDSLMGPSRDVSRKVRTGEDFKDGNAVCQHYLIGFCPGACFGKNVEDDLVKPCAKLHAVALKEELKDHPEASKYKRIFEKALFQELEDMTREADLRASYEKKKCLETAVTVKIPGHVQPKLEVLEEKLSQHLKEADVKGSNGDISGSQEAMATVESCKRDIEGIKHSYSTYFPGEAACEACGIRYLFGRKGGFHGNRSCDVWEETHFASKQHRGWLDCREKLSELREAAGTEKEDNETDQSRRASSRERTTESVVAGKEKQDNETDRIRRGGREAGKETQDNETDRSRRGGREAGKETQDNQTNHSRRVDNRERSRSHGRAKDRGREGDRRDRNVRDGERERDRRDRRPTREGDRRDGDRGRERNWERCRDIDSESARGSDRY